jgi:uncharacterized protein (TIGR02246 family)
MKIAVAGATGRIGSLTGERLERLGHGVVRLSRSLGIDLTTDVGLDDLFDGVDAVIDVTNIAAATDEVAIERFGAATGRLLAAAEHAGVGHYVLLSIVGVDRVAGNSHYAGKREQERLVAAGPVPWSVVRASQFHDFAEMVAGWNEHDGVVSIAPLLVQPIAPQEVAQFLVETALAEALRDHVDVAGPEPQDLVDMARRTYAARGRSASFVPTWSATFGPSMAGDVLLPTEGARLGSISFDEWLAEQVAAGTRSDDGSGSNDVAREEIAELLAAAVRHQSDVEPFLAMHDDDVVVVNIAGRRVLGRGDLEAAMRAALASPLADVSTAVDIDDVRFLTPDVALVSCTKHVVDGRVEPGDELPTAGAMSYVVVRRAGNWQIALAHTTPIRPPSTSTPSAAPPAA